MLQLIQLAGDRMSDHIWYRAIKIITNEEDVQKYATRVMFQALQSKVSPNVTAVKVGSYLVGEYGNLIAEDAGTPLSLSL